MNRTLTGWLGTSAEALVGQPFHALLSFGGRIAYETHLAPLLRLQGYRRTNLRSTCCMPTAASCRSSPTPPKSADRTVEHLFTRLTMFKAVDRRTYERGLVAAQDPGRGGGRRRTRDRRCCASNSSPCSGMTFRNPLAALAAGIRMIGERETLSDRGQADREGNGRKRIARDGADRECPRFRARPARRRTYPHPRSRRSRSHRCSSRSSPKSAPSRRIARSLTAFLDRAAGRLRPRPDRAARLEPDRQCGDPWRPGRSDRGGSAHRATAGSSCRSPMAACRSRPAARAQLFQPFFRGAVRRSQQGLGLGLFIVNEIAKAHGGTMDVASSDEETRFTFSMPLIS